MGWIGRKEISLVSYDVVLVTEVGNKGAELLEDSLEAVTDLVGRAYFIEFRKTE